MADGTVVYVPQAVLVPPDAGVERTFGKYRLSAEQDAFCDHETVFCDVFVSPDGSLCCIGPPFGSLGKPTRVSINGRRRRFRVEIPATGRVFALVRVPVDDREVDSPLRVDVDFRSFSVSFTHVPDLGAVDRVDLMLGTIQKDNHPLWIRDWCMWHSRVHGVERIVIYDNGSEDWDGSYAGLGDLGGVDLVLVKWNYPFGPPDRLDLNFSQPAAANHCRLKFGHAAAWLVSLDLDEYLYNTTGKPLASVLESRGRDGTEAIYLRSYVVPFVVDRTPRRCFDSPTRFRSFVNGGEKYIYRPPLAKYCGTHWIQATEPTPLERVRTLTLGLFQRTTGGRKLMRFLSRLKKALKAMRSRGTERVGGTDMHTEALFFYHFRSLNTGWKYARKIVRPNPADVVDDDRITSMKAVLDRRA